MLLPLWTSASLAILIRSAVAQDLPTKPVLTLEAAEKIMASATAEARRLNAPHGSFAVVDDAGYLLVFKRLDHSLPATAQVAVGKARTAAIFRMTSANLENAVNQGRFAMLSGGFNVGDGFTCMRGGIPLTARGQVIGAIGVSGAASAEQDEQIGRAVVEKWERGLSSAKTSPPESGSAMLAQESGGKTGCEPGLLGAPLGVVDLATRDGAASVQGIWRYHDVKIVERDFFAPAADGQPGVLPNHAYDFEPHAGAAFFDDSKWPVIEPGTLSERRAAGKLCFNWYRLQLTVPKALKGVDLTGSTVVLDTALDDYAEIWLDGEIPHYLGQTEGAVVAGWNASQRVIVGRNVRPEQHIRIAIFGINGPISVAPPNYIFVRHARLAFYPGLYQPVAADHPTEVNISVQLFDPRLDKINPKNLKLYKLADGFEFTEGPVWVKDHLLFSDPNANTMYRYDPVGQLSVFRQNSGLADYAGIDSAKFAQPGANGNTLDLQGRLTTCEMGNRRLTRTEPDGTITVLADRYEGKRFNSPNDLVFKSDGSLYFTDPPFGLRKMFDDPSRELDFSGVFRWKDNRITLITRELKGPNGIAFSPGEKYLYVGNWDSKKVWLMRYPLNADGTVARGELIFDLTGVPPTDTAFDGMKVDKLGNVYITGPGGINGGLWVLTQEGKRLGFLELPKQPHNLNWGGNEGKDLYITAMNTVYRLPLLVEGVQAGIQAHP